MLKLEKRPQPSAFWSYAAPIVAVLITMVFGAALFAALGKAPIEALSKIFWEPLFGEFNFFYLPQLLVKGAPLVAIALGLSLGFKAGIWNIGAEGQYIIGSLCGAAVALALYPSEARWLVFPAMLIAGAFGGFAWNPEGMGFPGSRNMAQMDAATSWIDQSNGMHWGVVIALIAVIFAYILFAKHILGFQIKLAGQAPRAAAFSGVNPARLILFCLGTSGALAGIGGDIAQSSLGLPGAAIQVFQGMLLFSLLAVDVLTNYRVRFNRGVVA